MLDIKANWHSPDGRLKLGQSPAADASPVLIRPWTDRQSDIARVLFLPHIYGLPDFCKHLNIQFQPLLYSRFKRRGSVYWAKFCTINTCKQDYHIALLFA